MMSINEKMIDKVKMLAKVVGSFSGSIDSISTMLLCLMESQCLQIRAEECDEKDKQNIRLIGTKDYFHPAHTDKELKKPNAKYDGSTAFHTNDSLY